MTVRRSLSAVVATMLAFVAVLGMSALGGWPAATFHDDVPERVVSVDHVHVADLMDGHDDNVVHIAAHAVGHAFEVPAHATPSIRLAAAMPAWPIVDGVGRTGTGPASLLRPPRG